MSEKLDYIPGVFQVHRHIRGKWVRRRCEKLIQAPVPAQVPVAKYADHQPLYRQEEIFAQAGVAIENRIRPVALGRANWVFTGSLRAGHRAAVVMSLIQSAKLNGHDPYRYLKDVLERLPSQPASRVEDLLPHNWRPLSATH